jgi:phage baseplate assembly protein W
MARNQAWSFVHPQFDRGAANAGLEVSATGAIATVAGDAAVRQALLLLLTTQPGERVMRPEYGCDLHRLVFAPNDATTHGLAIHYVRQAVESWEPRVDLLHIDAAAAGDDAARMDIVLRYRVRRTLQQDSLTLSVALAEGKT